MRMVACDMDINVSPAKIIRAFADAEMLKGWWGVERSLIELKTGGIYTLAWGISGDGFKFVSTGIVKKYDPGKILQIGDFIYLNPERPVLGPVMMTVEVSSNQKGARLHLTQGPYPEGKGKDWDWFYDVVRDAWPKVLQTLKKYLEK